MAKLSAGLLLRRRVAGTTEVLLVHPGGPFWARRDAGAWSVPKGEHDPDEDPWQAARREFAEELGAPPPDALPGDTWDLGEVRQSGGKRVRAWSLPGDLDVSHVASNEVTMEWPRGSGRTVAFPEVDRAAWFDLDEARVRILSGQVELLDRLATRLDPPGVTR